MSRKIDYDALRKICGWTPIEARQKMREIAGFWLKATQEQFRDLCADINRYQEVRRGDHWREMGRWFVRTTRTTWYCVNRRCIIREASFHHSEPVNIATVIAYPDELSPGCPFCGELLMLKRDRK